jgi:O-antigen/teichoic acid export membrane protein
MRLTLTGAFRVAGRAFSRYSHLNLSLIDQIIISGANFITGILLARHLGIREFGQFSLLWLVAQFLQAVQNAAIILPMMSFGPRQSADSSRFYYAVVFSHELIFAFLSAVFVVSGIWLGEHIFREWNIWPLLWPFTLMIFTTQIQDFLRRYFFSVGKAKISIVVDMVRYGGQTFVFLWLFLFSSWQSDIAEVLWTMLIAAGASIFVAWSKTDNIEWSFDHWRSVSLRHWHSSKWLMGTTFAGWASGELYYVIAGGILGPSAVGVLKAAQTVMGVTNIFFQGMQNYIPVRASVVFREGGVAQLAKFIRKSTLMMVLATASIAAMACVYPNYVMEFIYGPQFRDYGWVLVGYAIIYIVTAFGVAFPVGLLILEKTFPTLLAYIISGVVSIVIMYPLVRVWGLIGVLIGLTVYPAIQSLIQFVAFQKLVALGKTTGGFPMFDKQPEAPSSSEHLVNEQSANAVKATGK